MRVLSREGRGRAIVFWLLRMTGLPALLRVGWQRDRLLILLFHQQTPERFAESARALSKRYQFVSLGQVLDALDRHDMSSLPRRPLLITFDDGRASNAALIPVFERYKITPTIFVTTGLVGTGRHFWWSGLSRPEVARLQTLPNRTRLTELDRLGRGQEREHPQPEAISTEQLRALCEVADVQPHTRTHPVLTACTPDEVREEIRGSLADVERMCGTAARVFAYPNGEVSQEVVSLVGECGIDYAMTTAPGFVESSSDPFRLGRIFVRDNASVSELIVFASGLQALLKRLIN